MNQKRTILIATTNPGKRAELAEMLDFDIRWLTLADIENFTEIEEDGQTFAENARKKAAQYASQTGHWTIADDSGLSIDALDGQPGIHSARFSGTPQPHTNRSLIDHKNIEKVLQLMQNIEREKRTARFVCALCLASPQEVLAQTQGTLEGLITEKELGSGGFGYDPIFLIPHLNKTVAQLSPAEKNAISHRGNAIRKLKPLLAMLVGSSE
ncbi:MAG: XTP/dITP diphosphatase [Phycisphaerae bacterium]|nr:XTP/dITP diphosphatase [Phycisphaerae bacterium]